MHTDIFQNFTDFWLTIRILRIIINTTESRNGATPSLQSDAAPAHLPETELHRLWPVWWPAWRHCNCLSSLWTIVTVRNRYPDERSLGECWSPARAGKPHALKKFLKHETTPLYQNYFHYNSGFRECQQKGKEWENVRSICRKIEKEGDKRPPVLKRNRDRTIHVIGLEAQKKLSKSG